MAIILMEEVLMGLDETKDALGQAVFTLENLIDDLSPDLRDGLHDIFVRELLHPLQSRCGVIGRMLVALAEETEADA